MIRRLKWDLLVFAILGVVGFGWWLDGTPMLVGAGHVEVVGSLPPGTGEGDVLLVLPKREDVSDAASFDDVDFSLGWYNTLLQEQGACAMVEVTDLTASHVENRRLVVVTRASAQQLSPGQVEVLEHWVVNGGVLLVEQPGPALSELTRLPPPSDDVRRTRRLTAADGVPLRGHLRDALLNAPLLSTMKTLRLPAQVGPGTADATGPDVLVEVDGRPGVVHVPRGTGHVYVLTFDLARAVVTIQQGLPADDFSPRPQEATDAPDSDDGPLVAPSRFVAEPRLLEASVPYADLIERNITAIAAMHVPIPRMWYFPRRFAGAYIITHDEDGAGDEMLFYQKREIELNLPSTTFATSGPMTGGAMNELHAAGLDVQLGWSRLPDGPGKVDIGIGSWRPIQRQLSLPDQKRWVEQRLQVQPTTINRSSEGLVDADWTSTFRKLAAARVVGDSSYGPSREGEIGYLFGTGLPFFPLDKNGMLLPVAEVPTVLRDDVEFQPSHHFRMIRRSESGYHQVIVANFRSSTMAKQPTVRAIETWERAPGVAKNAHHWLANMRDFLLFNEARQASKIRSRFVAESRRLDMRVYIEKPRIAAQDEPPLPSVAFPQRYEGTGVEAVFVDNRPISLSQLGRSGDGIFHILEVPAGNHEVRVVYAGSVVEEP